MIVIDAFDDRLVDFDHIEDRFLVFEIFVYSFIPLILDQIQLHIAINESRSVDP